MECTGIARKTAGLCDILLFVTAMAASFGYVVSGKRAREMPADRVVCWGEKVTDKTLAVMAIAARRACLEKQMRGRPASYRPSRSSVR
ncbi:hypothetical protein CIT25_04180 [Mesorhizobium mediterraneum]|uniref:Uncharacterized protein n=1 Tax=Mesorhizobium mediterraneum TaxID=43617 RepID=A0AB36RGY1_9HYPH|nr:hypothetical protein CIT25_04180 [Mesorhizobium mediterraneum]